MRCDQHVGLSARGREILDELLDPYRTTVKIEKKTTWPDGHVTVDKYEEGRSSYTDHVYDHFHGFDEHDLFEYRTPEDKPICREYVQAEPWSSGPMFFLALKDAKGNVIEESLWNEEDINNA